MSNMKRTLLVLVASLVVLVLSAGIASAAKMTLVLWDSNTQLHEVWKKYIAQYEKLNPDIDIKLEAPADYDTKIPLGFASGKGFDITWGAIGVKRQDIPKLLAEYPKDLFPEDKIQDDFIGAAGSLVNGKRYGSPAGKGHLLLFYNRTFLDEAGIAEVPESYAELKNVGAKLTKIGADGKVTRNGFSFYHYAVYLWMNSVYQLGGRLLYPDRVDVSSNEAMRSMDLLEDLRKAKLGSGAFNDKTAAIQYTGGWMVNRVGDIKWGVARIPTWTGSPKPALSMDFYNQGWLAVPKAIAPERQREAFKFIKWLTWNVDFQVDYNKLVGSVPTMKAALGRPEIQKDPILKVIAASIPYDYQLGSIGNFIDLLWDTPDFIQGARGELKKPVPTATLLQDFQRIADDWWKKNGAALEVEPNPFGHIK